ncbi:MAG: tetratricopeptide repeat protein [Desulfobacteraceae bacterium]|nr:tetratricopeptide repeat protein [Desulfobacteraceae bacterium]
MENIYTNLRQAEKTIEYYKQALAVRRKIGDRSGEGNVLGNLCLAYSDLGRTDKARQYLQESIAVFEEIRSPIADTVRDWLDDLI